MLQLWPMIIESGKNRMKQEIVIFLCFFLCWCIYFCVYELSWCCLCGDRVGSLDTAFVWWHKGFTHWEKIKQLLFSILKLILFTITYSFAILCVRKRTHTHTHTPPSVCLPLPAPLFAHWPAVWSKHRHCSSARMVWCRPQRLLHKRRTTLFPQASRTRARTRRPLARLRK